MLTPVAIVIGGLIWYELTNITQALRGILIVVSKDDSRLEEVINAMRWKKARP